jgi:hypothetical protein
MYDWMKTQSLYVLIPHPTQQMVRKKVYAGNPIEFQRRLHRLSDILLRDENTYTILRTPKLYESPQEDYWMESVDRRHPIWLGDPDSVASLSRRYPSLLAPLTRELTLYWISMWDHGYIPYGFQLYLQEDGSVVLSEFDTYGPRTQETSAYFPTSFFNHPSFPPDFKYSLESHLQLFPDFETI